MMNDWHGLYSEGWQNEIVDAAFAHPAKFARGLIRRIYEHAVEEGWLVEGDTVVDPFAGVALGGLDAMFHGLHWVGVELEGKFVGLGGQNIALWNSRYNNGMLPRWGTAVILQGDSRNLIGVLDGARAKGIVASSPYANSDVQQSHGQSWREELGTVTGSWRNLGTKYGDHATNLGNMREGNHAAVVSSPPYEGSAAHPSIGSVNKDAWGNDGRDIVARRGLNAEYGNTDGQLGQESGDTFWSAAKVIVSQCYQVLAPGGYAIWVVKAFVRNKAIVDFPEQWRELCKSCGFETLHRHRCWLVEDRGGQYALNGDLVERKVERKSFFRRLYEKKYPENSIDYEVVWCMRKPADAPLFADVAVREV